MLPQNVFYNNRIQINNIILFYRMQHSKKPEMKDLTNLLLSQKKSPKYQDSFDFKSFCEKQQFKPEAVIHTIDNRRQIKNTFNWPFCAIGEIASVFRKNDKSTESKGTITMVGPNVGITAAHNIYSHVSGEAEYATVTLGLSGNYHIVRCSIRKPFIFPALYKKLPFAQRIQHDYAFLVLDTEDLKDWTGYVGMQSNFQPNNQRIGLYGYPQDKYLYGLGGQANSYLWGDTGRVDMLPKSKNTFTYDISTNTGQSGAALLCLNGYETRIVGIHTNGGKTVNLGLRLSTQMLQQSNKQLWKHHRTSLY